MHDNDDDPLVRTWLGALISRLEKRGSAIRRVTSGYNSVPPEL